MSIPYSLPTVELCDRKVPRIGYGMGQVTRHAESSEGFERAVSLLRHAVDLGVRHIDTAQFYGDGLANRLVREALGARRDDLVLATKAGARPDPGAVVPLTAAQRPHEIRSAVEVNLDSLGTDRLDLVYLRRMDYRPGLLAEGEQVVNFEDQLAEMVALRDEGKIVDIGLSHITDAQLDLALPVGIAAVQNIYHLLGREFEAMLTTCREHGVAWIPYFPLGGGGQYAGLPKVVDDATVQAVAAELGATATQVGLAWQLAHSPATLLIPGTGSVEHLEENVAAGLLRLEPAQLLRLGAVA